MCAQWDSADLLAKFNAVARRPTTDAVTDATKYLYLEMAQVEWYANFMAHVPWMVIGAPVALSTADSGATYTFSGSITPGYVQIFENATGRLLLPGENWDPNADYVWEGDKIRIPRGRTKTWANGPVARYVTPPTTLSAGVAPTLTPSYARLLLVYRACILFARAGGLADPTPYEKMEDDLWLGDPLKGRVGMLGAFQQQNPFKGASASKTAPAPWSQTISTGDGYVAL